MTVGYLGLGSNVGERREHLCAAVAELARHGVAVLASSSVYETEPVGLVLDQPDFLNACLRIDTAHGPEDLLDACKEVERVVGRAPGGERHAPRAIDVDVLLLGELMYQSIRLRSRTPRSAPAASCWCRCSSSTRNSGSPAGSPPRRRLQLWVRART